MYGTFSRGIFIDTVLYVACTRFWPTPSINVIVNISNGMYMSIHAHV